MSKLIVANWKMAPDSLIKAEKLFTDYSNLKKNKNFELVVAPPFVYLNSSKFKNKNFKLGAQDIFWINRPDEFHFTGEISLKMIKNLGVSHIIIGHSERRRYLNETDEMINKKLLITLEAGFKAILCVGEDLITRKRGREAVEFFIKNQLDKALEGFSGNPKIKKNNLIIAYEPVWAIGSSHADSPEDAYEVAHFIKNILDSKFLVSDVDVLYGGSVDSRNAKIFLKYEEINGFLVGGASLKINEIKKIIEIINYGK